MPRVLLVDDSPVQLTTRELVLRRAGVEVHVATTAASALALLRSKPNLVDLVITDHIMPETSGSEFVRELRHAVPHVPVMVVSGLAEAASEYDGLNVTFREKPLDPDELIALVARLTAA